ncbi:MAG: FtsX-like permease family protein [Azospirillum sp.]|nr:FtsX-like permease family protein [Azospirillum sp.]
MFYRTPLGWLQLRHRPMRLVVAICGVMFANLLMFMQFGFLGSLIQTTVQLQSHLIGDIVISSTSGRQLQGIGTVPRRRLLQSLAVPGVRDMTEVYSGLIDWINPTTGKTANLTVIGIDPEVPVFLDPDIDAQRFKLRTLGSALMDRRARGDWSAVIRSVEAGGVLTTEISGRQARVEGLFSMGATFGADGTLIVSRETFLSFTGARSAGAVSFGLVRLAPGVDPGVTVEALRTVLAYEDTKVETMAEFLASHKRFLAQDSPVSFVFRTGAFIGLLVGAAIVYQILYADVNEHMSEYAMLKSLGYSHGYLLGVVCEQAAILAVLGYLPSLAAAAAVYAVVAQATALPLVLTFDRAANVFALTCLMCAVSGALATRRLRAADPADIF